MNLFKKGKKRVLFSSILIAILILVIYVMAVDGVDFLIKRDTPANGTAVATTAFTFNCTYSTNGTGSLSNATLFFGLRGAGAPPANLTTLDVGNGTANGTGAIVNFTVTGISEGTYLWACGATNTSNGKFVNSTSPNNWSITFDTTSPLPTGLGPNSISTPTNYTSLPITFNVTITEASNISSVFYILNTQVAAGGANAGLNDSGIQNSSNLMTLALQSGSNYSYVANLSLNFTSTFTQPGAHSLWFCANDTANNVRCSPTSLSFVVKGVNITELNRLFSGGTFGGFTMNMTLENFTKDEDNFMAPTTQNYTITFNLTANEFVNIVGMTINESYMRDASNTQMNRSVTSNVRDAMGADLDLNVSFMNVTSFLPEGALYKFGRFDFLSKNFEKLYRCNGSSADSPGTCTTLSRCIGNMTDMLNNHSGIIPTNSACFVKNLTNATGIDSGNTYIFSDTFSGGGGANDTTAPRISFVEPANGSTITRFPVIFNVTFTDGTGIDNRSINITVLIGNDKGNVSNMSNWFDHRSNEFNTSLLSCRPNTNETSPISCNITFNTLPNGTINITVSARDASTARTLNVSSITLQVSVTPHAALISPKNGTIFNNRSFLGHHITFNYTAFFTATNQSNCTLWGNLTTATFAPNQTNATTLVSGTPTNFSGLNLSEGTYLWNVQCNDTYARSGFNTSSNFTFTIDITNPNVGITATPATINSGETVTIGCSASDNMDRNPTASLTSVTKPDGKLSSDVDGTFTDTSSSGTYTAKCTATDHGGLTSTVTKTFTVNEQTGTSGGGGAGGGGGGAVSKSTTIFSKVEANIPVEAKISNSESGIDIVSLTANEGLSNVKITVSELSESPVETIVSGTVFKYVEIKAANAPDEKLKSVTVNFHVDKAWLAENNADAEDVALSRYENEAWKELTVEKLSEDDKKVYFKASSSGLSYYAIAVKQKEAAALPTTEEAVAETPAVTPSGEVMVKEEKPSRAWLWAILGLLAVGAIAIGIYLAQKKR